MENLRNGNNNKGFSIVIILVSILIIVATTVGIVVLLKNDNNGSNTTINQSNANTVNNNSNNNVTEMTAKEKIVKCIKDEQWVSNNIMMKTSCFENTELTGKQILKCYFLSNESEPVLYVIASSEEDLSMQGFVVMCVNGEVKATPITSTPIHIEHNSISFNKDTVLLEYAHMGDNQSTYYSVRDAKLSLKGGLGFEEDGDGNKISFKTLNSQGIWENCSEEEYLKTSENYSDLGIVDFVEFELSEEYTNL